MKPIFSKEEDQLLDALPIYASFGAWVAAEYPELLKEWAEWCKNENA